MSNPFEHNPFETLHLDPTAPNEQVVAQAGRLRQRAGGEDELTAVRQAVQALTGWPEERFGWEMLTHPGPGYDWPLLERFRAAFRRPPRPGSERPRTCPPLDLAEFADLCRPVLAAPGTTLLPFVEVNGAEPAEELERQNAEVFWQRLPGEGGA